MQVIDRFDGTYSFLSNFYPCQVTLDGLSFPTVENAFQAAKCADPDDRLRFQALSPGAAKRLGRKVSIRPDWNQRRLEVMESLLQHKFSEHPELAKLLLGTGDTVLVEGNLWHDNFWGSCTCSHCRGLQGENHLGRLLMKIRAQCQSGGRNG